MTECVMEKDEPEGILEPPDAQHILFERRWFTLTSDQPIALLEG